MIFIKKSIVIKNKFGIDWGDCLVFIRFYIVLDKLDSDYWCFLFSEVYVYVIISLYVLFIWNVRFFYY